MPGTIHQHFTPVDWCVLFGYLLLTTWVGHRLAGRQANIRDFFLAGRSLPWPAVSGSIIATEISALTFIGVPGMVFAAKGNFTYLQWMIGSIIARVIVGLFFVRVFYEREIYSPYDYMEHRLGRGAKTLGTVLFFLSAILGQSVRLLVTALILDVVIDVPWWEGNHEFWVCIFIIALFAVVWTWMGGMRTVIWTDVIQFGVFIFGGVFALIWLCLKIEGGFAGLWSAAEAAGKTKLLDLTTDPHVKFTLWVALLAMPFQNMAAFGTDQLNAQRMFCCRSARDARKAIIWSSIGQLMTVLMLLVGAGLYVYYVQNPPSPDVAQMFARDPDYVFPVFITTVVPPGLTGLILAGAFAAAISSLDSVLAALSQSTLALLPSRAKSRRDGSGHDARLLLWSRYAVIGWAVVLAIFAVFLDSMRGNVNLVVLAFGIITYVYGPLLGMFLTALTPGNRTVRGVAIGFGISFLLAIWVRGDLAQALFKSGMISGDTRAALAAPFADPWLFPLTTAITYGCGVLLGKKRNTKCDSSPKPQSSTGEPQ